MAESQLPANEYIIQKGGIYSWNSSINIILDTDIFIKKIKEARNKNIKKEQSIILYREAIALYKGEFLPRLSYEEWTVPLRVYYHRAYIECIKELFNLIKENEEWQTMISICEKAIDIDPYDEEIYGIYIYILMELSREKQAVRAYEEIRDRLYNELGVNPSEGLKKVYKQLLKKIKKVETDLLSIRTDLNEETANLGTFCTDYEIFKGIYRFTARSVERTGASVYIMLCTVTGSYGELPKVEVLSDSMNNLKNSISKALRKGDAFAQYSISQYIIILHGTDYENALKVGERISSIYRTIKPSKNIKIDIKLQPLEPKLSINGISGDFK